jgi:hypothetical protein
MQNEKSNRILPYLKPEVETLGGNIIIKPENSTF